MNGTRTARSVARQRGVVYIESLLVIAALVVIFAASVYLSAAYKAKLESFDFASAVAFRDAEKGCGPPLGGSYNIGALLAKGSTSITNPDPAYLGGAVEGPTATAAVPIGSPVLFPGKTLNLAVTAHLLCNEVPISKDDAWKALGAEDWAVQGVLTAAGF